MATATAPPPRPWNPSFKFSDRERWICVYPVYINGKRTVAEGRRLKQGLCVDNPTYSEMRDVCVHAGMTIGVENKVHPREKDPKDLKFRGRIRIQMKNDDGSPMLEQFPSRQSVMKYLGEMIPKLKHRQSANQGATSSSSQPQAAAGGGGKKKKSRKK